MKNPILIIAIVVVLAVGGVFLYSQSQNQSAGINSAMEDDATIDDNNSGAMMQKDDTAMPDQGSTDNNSGSGYVVFSNSDFDQTTDVRRVLFFYANWCPTCRPVDESLQANASKIPPDVKVIRVNYNDSETDEDEKELARRYKVTYQHTFVQIDSEGNEVKKWNGGGLDELLANIN